MPKIIVVIYIGTLIVTSFLSYQSLKAFDFEKILRRNKTKELFLLMGIISFIMGFLVAEAVTGIINQLISFVTK